MNDHQSRVARSIATLFLSAGLVSGCGSRNAELPAASSAAQSRVNGGLRAGVAERCRAFVADFNQAVACERANGTLLSFGDPKIGWRVRYFVRYWEMPCGEFPTEQEGYVFHIVTDDLYGDADLTPAQRMAIRTAMFDGRVQCR